MNHEINKAPRTNKTHQVLMHLFKYGTIESWQAINNYGATRLSAIIFNLKKKGYCIDSEDVHCTDRNGNFCPYVRYHLIRKGV